MQGPISVNNIIPNQHLVYGYIYGTFIIQILFHFPCSLILCKHWKLNNRNIFNKNVI